MRPAANLGAIKQHTCPGRPCGRATTTSWIHMGRGDMPGGYEDTLLEAAAAGTEVNDPIPRRSGVLPHVG